MFDANDRVLNSLEELGLVDAAARGLESWWRARVKATLDSPVHRQREARFTLIIDLYTDDLVRIRRRADEVRMEIRAYLEGAAAP